MIAATRSIQWRVSTTPGASVEWGTPPAIYEALFPFLPKHIGDR